MRRRRGVFRRRRPCQDARGQAEEDRRLGFARSRRTGAVLSALIEGVIVGTRGTDLRKTEPTRHPFEELLLIVSGDERDDREGHRHDRPPRQIVGDAVNLARDLANTPPAEKSPTALARRRKEIGDASGLIVEIWDESRIRAERFGGLLGVAAGSAEPPAFVGSSLPTDDPSTDPGPGRQGGDVRLGRPLAQADARRWRT